MATIINNPPAEFESSNSGMILGVILLMLVIVVLLFAGRTYVFRGQPLAPAPTQMNQVQEAPPQTEQKTEEKPAETNIQVPDINVPDKIDVNINQPTGTQ